MLSGHIGVAAQGDVRDWTVMPAASMAVLDDSGLGVEVDVSHAGDFDSAQFTDSSLTSATLNFIAMYPHETLRPFFTAGVGVIRVRVTFFPDQPVGHTDSAWNAGGGVLYMLNEALGFRGDVRYFRHFGRQAALPLGANAALDFVRSTFGVVFSWPMH
jgi:opacity protein-like surface antigen